MRPASQFVGWCFSCSYLREQRWYALAIKASLTEVSPARVQIFSLGAPATSTFNVGLTVTRQSSIPMMFECPSIHIKGVGQISAATGNNFTVNDFKYCCNFVLIALLDQLEGYSALKLWTFSMGYLCGRIIIVCFPRNQTTCIIGYSKNTAESHSSSMAKDDRLSL